MKEEIEVSFKFEVNAHQDDGDGVINCHIPLLNIHFNCNTWEQIKPKAAKLIGKYIALAEERFKSPA